MIVIGRSDFIVIDFWARFKSGYHSDTVLAGFLSATWAKWGRLTEGKLKYARRIKSLYCCGYLHGYRAVVAAPIVFLET